MLDDTFYLYARFKSSDNGYYVNNKNYLLRVRIGRFNKRVKIAHVHGFDYKEHANSERRYGTREAFEASWKVIKDATSEVK